MDKNGHFSISAYQNMSPSYTDYELSLSYVTACDPTTFHVNNTTIAGYSLDTNHDLLPTTTYISASASEYSSITNRSDLIETFVAARKYKPVALRTKPVATFLPDKFRIIRNIVGDPLADMPALTPNPPPFAPTGRYTAKRRDIIDK